MTNQMYEKQTNFTAETLIVGLSQKSIIYIR